ncbi:hypothetical protein BGZ61DRAFT_584469 [Ilyonectria robusta]|uniref:uncharacterized protein n=1 Tax=Ilyonectria robusta TaxID=1079257 RepID=UPI001E8CC64A|nr:uncharacterized protein BGZ61DRAFT_584469 [Ilyonectria robusta]KAH8734487.1 hypothetical protein BGZ61DRAFT_584469 [Ilyonectria robusta]
MRAQIETPEPITYIPPPPPDPSDIEVPDQDVLDDEHKETFRQALRRLLSTPLAEYTYAQILDGLPTEPSLRDSYVWMPRHPVYELEHTELCEGFLDKARDFMTKFDAFGLRFKQSLLRAFQNTTSGSQQFNLRLIELVVVACHQIAAHLYELDDGAHKHQLHQDWVDAESQVTEKEARYRSYALTPTAFFHRFYQAYDQYPRGCADVAGYWAEGKIFGGVVVFDRGETEQECNSMWIHGSKYRGPKTLYPPMPEQFDALISFLLAKPDDEVPCPLPIFGTRMNRPRWDAYDAITRFHIFRDKYERKVPTTRPQPGRVQDGADWPEILDEHIVMTAMRHRRWGRPVDEEELAAAQARLKEVTPSSPCWTQYVPNSEHEPHVD